MAKYIKNILKRSRKIGCWLFLKTLNFDVAATKYKKLGVLPGQHGLRRKKISNYLLQLKAKQTIKFMYNIFERQLKLYFEKAFSKKGNTGLLLFLLLESRLDNIVYRMGFASTRAEARQMVVHKHVMVSENFFKDNNKNNFESFFFSDFKWKIINKPSFQVKVGSFIAIHRLKLHHTRIKNAMQNELINQASWVSVNKNELFGKLENLPKRSDLPSFFNEDLIIELYSK